MPQLTVQFASMKLTLQPKLFSVCSTRSSQIGRAGIAFLRRLYDLTQGVKWPSHFIRLRPEVKADLLVWLTFLSSFNGFLFSALKSGVIHFRYSYHERPFTLPIKCRLPTCCPIALLLDYLTLRGNHEGVPYLKQHGTAVMRLLAGCLKHLTGAVSTHLVI